MVFSWNRITKVSDQGITTGLFCRRGKSASGNRVTPTLRRSSPVYVEWQTFSGSAGMSEACQRVALCVQAAGCYLRLDAAPGSLYPPHQGNEFGNEPGQDKRQDHDTCDRIPVRHEEDSSAYARRVGRKKAVKSPSGDPGFVPGQQQTAHNQPNNRRQQAETFPAFDLHSLVPATHPVVEDKPPKQ